MLVAQGTGEAPESAESLAQRLSLGLLDPDKDPEQSAPYAIAYIDGALSIYDTGSKSPKPLCVDFCTGALRYRQKHSRQPEALLKALGAKRQESHTVIDATAGWGLDSFIMATAGYEVTMLERSVVMHALLNDGIARARSCGQGDIEQAAQRMHLRLEDAESYLGKSETQADIIYLDPMFPERKKSAQVKKNMQLLHGLLGEAKQESSLLGPSLQRAKKRVVVKRPRIAAPLQGAKAPDYQLEGKANRFDVYLTAT